MSDFTPLPPDKFQALSTDEKYNYALSEIAALTELYLDDTSEDFIARGILQSRRAMIDTTHALIKAQQAGAEAPNILLATLYSDTSEMLTTACTALWAWGNAKRHFA